MFAEILAEIGSRGLSLDKLLTTIEQIEAAQNQPSSLLKGLAFVQMYALYEFTVRSSVQATLAALKGDALLVKNIRRETLCLILNSRWQSASESGVSKMWESRINLLHAIHSDDSTSTLDDSIFPFDGSHYRSPQLKTVWRLMGIPFAVVPEPRLIGRIDELVENRNAVAHGRRTPEDVGRAYSWQDIGSRIVDVKSICEYVHGTLLNHYSSGGLVAA
jgi:hypothetical protein